MKISVSVLNLDFSHLEKSIKSIEKTGIDSLHMDIMDGHFVDNISFGPSIVDTISKITSLPVYTHLMIEEPEKYIEEFFKAGSDSVTVHVETIDSNNKSILDMDNVGLSLNPDIKISTLDPYLNKVDTVLLMSVYAGFGGQEFIKSSIGRLETLKKKRDEIEADYKIAVDGGVNPKVAPDCYKAGADEIIVGSYITKSADPASAVERLRDSLSI